MSEAKHTQEPSLVLRLAAKEQRIRRSGVAAIVHHYEDVQKAGRDHLQFADDIRDVLGLHGEMLAALKGLMAHSHIADSAAEDKDEEDHAAERAARYAIAKAEGAVTQDKRHD